MIRLELLGPWNETIVNGEPEYRPQVATDYPLEIVNGVGEQFIVPIAGEVVPDPNVTPVLCILDDAKVSTIRSNSVYYILWEEPV